MVLIFVPLFAPVSLWLFDFDGSQVLPFYLSSISLQPITEEGFSYISLDNLCSIETSLYLYLYLHTFFFHIQLLLRALELTFAFLDRG